MNYLACVRSADAPFEERCVVSDDYTEFMKKTSALARKFLNPTRAKAVNLLLNDFQNGGDVHIDDFIMAGSPGVDK